VRLQKLKEAADRAEKRFARQKEVHANLVAIMRTEPLVVEAMIREPSQAKALWQVTFGRPERAYHVMQVSLDTRK